MRHMILHGFYSRTINADARAAHDAGRIRSSPIFLHPRAACRHRHEINGGILGYSADVTINAAMFEDRAPADALRWPWSGLRVRQEQERDALSFREVLDDIAASHECWTHFRCCSISRREHRRGTRIAVRGAAAATQSGRHAVDGSVDAQAVHQRIRDDASPATSLVRSFVGRLRR